MLRVLFCIPSKSTQLIFHEKNPIYLGSLNIIFFLGGGGDSDGLFSPVFGLSESGGGGGQCPFSYQGRNVVEYTFRYAIAEQVFQRRNLINSILIPSYLFWQKLILWRHTITHTKKTFYNIFFSEHSGLNAYVVYMYVYNKLKFNLKDEDTFILYFVGLYLFDACTYINVWEFFL